VLGLGAVDLRLERVESFLQLALCSVGRLALVLLRVVGVQQRLRVAHLLRATLERGILPSIPLGWSLRRGWLLGTWFCHLMISSAVIGPSHAPGGSRGCSRAVSAAGSLRLGHRRQFRR